ncbi:hypothetical protein OIY81_3081, partial [Cryptosporidium canis]
KAPQVLHALLLLHHSGADLCLETDPYPGDLGRLPGAPHGGPAVPRALERGRHHPVAHDPQALSAARDKPQRVPPLAAQQDGRNHYALLAKTGHALPQVVGGGPVEAVALNDPFNREKHVVHHVPDKLVQIPHPLR